MTEKTGTVRFHRVLKAPPERVYRAFIDPDAISTKGVRAISAIATIDDAS